MTKEELIVMLRKLDECKCSCASGLTLLEYDKIHEALEKQTPKTIKFKNRESKEGTFCPNCDQQIKYLSGNIFGVNRYHYCIHCGQYMEFDSDTWNKITSAEASKVLGLPPEYEFNIGRIE